jgi:gliding motility-associated-like protein
MRSSTKIFYFIIVGVLLPFFASAQYVSRLGNFQVDQIKGCAPLTVTITPITPCNGVTPCDINYQLTNLTADCNTSFASGQTIVQNNLVSPPYAPGKYKLTVLFQSIGCDDIIIEVLPNIQPDFEIYHCNGNDVSVKVTDTNYSYQYKIKYISPPSADVEVTVAPGNTAKDNHTFPSTGAKTIEVRGIIAANAFDNCAPKTDTIKVRTVPLPSFSQLEVLSPSSIKLDFINQFHVLYKLQIDNNGFQPLQDVYNSNTTTISSNISPDNNKFYCFRLGRNDPCTNTTNYGADKICSVDFDVAAADNLNNLSWITSSLGVVNYSISKSSGIAVPTQAPSATSYVDNNVLCELYTYQLSSNYSNGMISVSLPKTVTAFSTNIPPAITNITTSLSADGTASLIWQPGIQPEEYSIFRNNSLLTTTSTEQFTDEGYSLDANYCYSITYKNQCNNTSPPATSCPVKLESKVSQDNITVLSWNAYTGWANGVSTYVVEKYSAEGELIKTIDNGTNTTFTDNTVNENNQAFYYIVKAYPNTGGVSPATSNERYVTLNPIVIFPKAFTPNNDDRNEVFMPVKDQYVTEFEMQIFNRWGELIFSSQDIENGWDGTFKGAPLPNGIYAFSIRIIDNLGRKSKNNGSLLLLRPK